MLGAGAALGSKGFACHAGLGAGPGAPQRHTLSSSPVPERRETGWGFEGERVLMHALYRGPVTEGPLRVFGGGLHGAQVLEFQELGDLGRCPGVRAGRPPPALSIPTCPEPVRCVR